MSDPLSRFDTLSLPEVRVVPALQGTHWVVIDWMGSGPLPDGVEVKARLMRSQLCHATLRTVGALRVLDIPAGGRWWARQDPCDDGFDPQSPSPDGRWDVMDPGSLS